MTGLVLTALAFWALMAPATLIEPANTTPAAPVTTVSPAIVPAPRAASATRAKDRPDEVVCKRLPISGTRVLGPKTCMARREWKSMEGRGMEDVEAAIRAARTRNCAGC